MKARYPMLVAIVAAVTLASVAAAGPEAAKQRFVFTTQAAETTTVSRAVLTPLQAGAIKPDSGKLIGGPDTNRVVMRDGQEVSIHDSIATFKGKRGSLVTSYRGEWVEAGNGYHVATSTWKVVRGTGQYTGVTGGGRGASVWSERTDAWSSHLEGFLSFP